MGPGWWGPGGASLRRGTRSILRGVSPGASASRVVGLLLIVGAVALAVDVRAGRWRTPASDLSGADDDVARAVAGM
mgnify:CR=1 FL=1